MRPIVHISVTVLSCILPSLGSAASAQTEPTLARSSILPNHAGIDFATFFGSIAPTGPGCVAGVAITGAPTRIAAYGQADLEHPDPLTAATVFETGSLAKQFTASALLLLSQDGKLSLDDDIRRYLPEIPDYGSPITVRHLLTHTSGLREQWSLLALTGNQPGTQVHGHATILDLMSRQKGVNFTPGSEFLYTNTNYTLAAMIIARVSGQSLQQFTDQRLFQPLGMSHTRWREDFRTIVPGRASAFEPDDTGFVASMPFTNVVGNGGLLTTVVDLLRWNAFLDNPFELPGGAALVAALETPGHLNNGAPLEYGLGLEVTSNHGRRWLSHSGSTGGYKTWLGRVPSEGISVALMCNNREVDPVEMGERLAEQALLATGNATAKAATSAPNGIVKPKAPTTASWRPLKVS
ncbi:MAG: beta-lactamase family protein [Gemmatimonadales bacterium]|nr:beta-lactamase family protein [Gemmatimonadales bacterium]